MATVLQGNGMKPLQNGTYTHLDMDKLRSGVGHELSSMKTDELCEVKSDLCDENEQKYQSEIPSAATEEQEVDIVINNVVCSFSVKCHLNLRQIALTGCHVEYRRENGVCKTSCSTYSYLLL